MVAATDLWGKANTVFGPVSPGELGLTLPHEHLLIDIENWYMGSDDTAVADEPPITLSSLARVRHRPFEHRGNLRLDDIDLAIREAIAFQQAGGRTIVDVTLPDIGRDLEALRLISERTKLNIIAGCGYYVHDTHAKEVETFTERELADVMIEDALRDPAHGVPCGVIGEIGVSPEITEREKKVLRAAAVAQNATGAPVSVHALPPGRSGLEAVEILTAEGVAADRIVVCHLDIDLNPEYHREIARMGAYLEFDLFGWVSTGQDQAQVRPPPPCDMERIRSVIGLVNDGFGAQLLLSHDICMKIQLTEYGGFGYGHLAAGLPLFFELCGLPQSELARLMTANPARWLTWMSPSGG